MSYVIASKTFITRQSLMMLLFAVLHQCALNQPSRRKASYRLASDGHIFDAEPEVMEEQVKKVWNLEETLKWKCFHLYIILDVSHLFGFTFIRHIQQDAHYIATGWSYE